MTKKYIKIIGLIINNFFDLNTFFKSIFEYSFYFVLLGLILKNVAYFSEYPNIQISSVSATYLIFIYIYKFFLENTLVFRYLLITGSLEQILIKPINPIFRVLVNKVDLAGVVLVISLFVITGYLGMFPNVIFLLSAILISISIFFLVLTLLIKAAGKIPFEKLLLGVLLIGLVSFGGVFQALPLLVTSVLLFFLSIKFWTKAVSRYESKIG